MNIYILSYIYLFIFATFIPCIYVFWLRQQGLGMVKPSCTQWVHIMGLLRKNIGEFWATYRVRTMRLSGKKGKKQRFFGPNN